MLAVPVPIEANLQAVIDANPPGSVFQLSAGIYRQAQFEPKAGDQFIGDLSGRTILSGAVVLERWARSARNWVHGNLPRPRVGQRVANSKLFASYLNDLFVDNVLYAQVSSPSQLTVGTWYFDQHTGSAYLSIDPSGHTVEYSVTPGLTYDNGATGVVIRNLTIEKYATDAQTAPIHGVRGWRIINITSTQNHGSGLNIGAGTVVQGGHYIANGQIGINGSHANGAMVLQAEIAGNNYAGYNPEWEAGGMKLALSSGVIVSGNYVHDNYGQGLWSDIDDYNFVYSNNTVTNNRGNGIMYEISFGPAFIYGNTVSCNGGAGIYISNSEGVEVWGNTVTIESTNVPHSNGAAGGGGIDIINAVRGAGPRGLYQSINNSVHDNTIIHLGGGAQDGIFVYQSIDVPGGANNTFDFNTYYVKDAGIRHWHFGRDDYHWHSLLIGKRYEAHGSVIAGPPPSTATECRVVKSGTATRRAGGLLANIGDALSSIRRRCSW